MMEHRWCEADAEATGRAGEEAGGRMAATVMLVEDERKLRDLVRSYLERAGFTVLSTGSGAEAIMMASTAAPDLIVLDLGLPDVPGETVASELRAVAPTPIVMLTAKSAEEDRIRGLELGADDYVTKPFSPRELVLRIQAVLRRGGVAAEQGVSSYGAGTLVIDRVRGYEFEGYERTVDSHVKNLRRKIEDDPANPQIIQTVLGGGYRLGLAADG